VKAPRNRTIFLSEKEIAKYLKRTIELREKTSVSEITNKTARGDFFETVKFLPENFVDLLILDPPYNLNKNFNGMKFTRKKIDEYSEYLEKIVEAIFPLLKPTATIYVCGDWRSSISIPLVLEKYFKIRNRITWEREKGRGSKTNWKNNSEDVWFATVSNDYYFDADAVKLKKRVIAPYRDDAGEPKDWRESKNGMFRMTYSSNVWTDISVPFWSMPENTEHPTQKPEKLIAKLVLASSRKGDFVFDPFLGSGTTSVVAKKLGRKFFGIERDEKYCAFCEYRLEKAENNREIQGYRDGVFWERNSLKKT
jgi:site-specific DNA-methyltransferase (adenine-specific)